MIAAVLTLVVIFALVGVILWAGGGKTVYEMQTSGIVEAIPGAVPEVPSTPAEICLVSYALAYGLGASTAEPPDATAVYDNLDHIIDIIAASGADVALLQEVDFASQRTYDVDQLHYIAAALGWGFAARAVTWECRYLPYPFWPPRRHTGRLRAGQGIISRFPLIQNVRQRLPQSRAHPLFAPLFAPYHTVQMVDMLCGERTVRLLNVHLDAHDAMARQEQAQSLVAFTRPVATPHSLLLGVFNSPLPTTSGHGEPGQATDHTMAVVCDQLRDRLRLVTDDPPTPPTAPLRHHLPYALVGPGLHAVDTQVLPQPTPVTEQQPLLVTLRWAVPPQTTPQEQFTQRLL